ncbi:hypothetical protein BTA51_09420 [Hahella sp. CCB-MM4]|uniref:sulfotransferase domain-containing protein n=1 Tax=Hahella sp. (strain CCB-MM4) TaxID=1926491 RepID=UPI000B9BE51B|nr:sulfotransferase domain-containing protein [Hahella sp. CCB-MM4]OZG73989.1 hypothetical protein BTA51_09420 [Hahella sp. CCB-MM4]
MKNKNDNTVYGLKVPYFINKERIDELINKVEFRESDVWLVTYPRSGTTLTQGILANILNKNASAPRYDIVPWPEVGDKNIRYYISLENLAKINNPRCFKSHWTASEHVDPIKSCAKFIHISRNCLDMVTSYYHQYLNPVDGNKSYNCSWNDFFEQFMASELRWGGYFHHYYSWKQHFGAPNILYLSYEEILTDMSSSIKKIADFISIDINSRDVKRITEACQFETMKAREPQMEHHFRRGIIGDHQRMMSEEQRNRLTLKMNEVKAQLQASFKSDLLSFN